LLNVTDGTTVTITALTEGVPGVYAVTYSAVTGANTFEASATAPGYDVAPKQYQDPA
jgi:hypothetical protein